MDSSSDALSDAIVSLAVQSVRQTWPVRPRVAIILGTGLGSFANQLDQEAVLPYEQLPGFPRTTAIGHRGRLVCGRLGATPVVAMEGRCHLYEGYTCADVTLPVRVMRELGAELLIASNAGGAVNPLLSQGEIMVISSHINLMGRRANSGMIASAATASHPGVASVERHTAPYDTEMLRRTLALARQLEVPAIPGVYVAMLGPNYETRAEYRMVRRLGGDIVGMSTVPEALAGYQCGLRIVGLSVVTNVARPDALEITSGLEVAQAAESAERQLGRLVRAIVADYDRG